MQMSILYPQIGLGADRLFCQVSLDQITYGHVSIQENPQGSP